MVKIGNQTPTQSVILPYVRSRYEEAIELYERSGRVAQPWQRKLMEEILAMNEDDLWTHTKFGYSLPRRNGKNELVIMREAFGLKEGELILHTAHRTSTSHSAWERLVKLLEMAGFVNGEDFTTLRATGREKVEFKESGGRVDFRTRTSTGGLGEGFDLLVIDEAQEYTMDQESALKYVVTDSKNPQTLLCGTPPTLVSSGTVFMDLRKKILAGGAVNAGRAEWGVDEESDPYDKELWYRTNPSLGTIFTERSVEDEVGDDRTDFNIQRLGLWVSYNQKSAISQKDWEALKVFCLPMLVGPLFVGVKYSKDSTVSLSVAVRTLSGRIFVEAIDCLSIRAGDGWILDFLSKVNPEAVVVDGASGQRLLCEKMKRLGLRAPLLPSVKEVIVANASFEQGVFEKKVCHLDQPSLSRVVTNCDKRPIGSAGGFGYRAIFSDMEIGLMDSVILAYRACSEVKDRARQKVWY